MTPLTVHQPGSPDFEMDARYDTKPFTGSPYYSARLGWWMGCAGWEVQFLHHKLYLANPSAEVSHLEISHGYNMVTVNRAWERWGLVLRGGPGIVYTFPETTVRGRKRPSWPASAIASDPTRWTFAFRGWGRYVLCGGTDRATRRGAVPATATPSPYVGREGWGVKEWAR